VEHLRAPQGEIGARQPEHARDPLAVRQPLQAEHCPQDRSCGRRCCLAVAVAARQWRYYRMTSLTAAVVLPVATRLCCRRYGVTTLTAAAAAVLQVAAPVEEQLGGGMTAGGETGDGQL